MRAITEGITCHQNRIIQLNIYFAALFGHLSRVILRIVFEYGDILLWYVDTNFQNVGISLFVR